jgi:hypothetical protein
MLLWRARTGAPVTVEAKFDDMGIGDLTLSRLVDGKWVEVGTNATAADPLLVGLAEPADGRLRLQLRAILGSPDEAAKRLYARVFQHGAELPVEDIVTGAHDGRLLPDAQYNSPTYYILYVAFQ